MTEPRLPAGFQHRWTDIGGIRIHAIATIDGARPTVVLVPGIGLSHRVMLPLAELLAPHLAVRAPDPPGFVRSDKPRRPLELPELADALAAWIDAAGLGRPALVGNSFGCQVIVELAARHPDLITCTVLQGPPSTPPPGHCQARPGAGCAICSRSGPTRGRGCATTATPASAGCWPPTGSPCATASRTSSPGLSPRPWSCVALTIPLSPRPGPRPSPTCSRPANWWSSTPAPTPSSGSWSRSHSHSSSATSRQQAEMKSPLHSSAATGGERRTIHKQ